MSTRNKTGDRLVASIRKTRQGAARKPAGKPAATGSTATAAGKKTAPRKAAPAASTTSKRPAAKPRRKAAGKVGGPALSPLRDDAYQFGRRIWPD